MTYQLGKVCEHKQLARACPHCDAAREEELLRARITALEEERDELQAALQESEARTERLESLLAWERGRGAAVAVCVRTLRELEGKLRREHPKGGGEAPYPWGKADAYRAIAENLETALSDPSPAATALLEVAEAAKSYSYSTDPMDGSESNLRAAVDRCQEVKNGLA